MKKTCKMCGNKRLIAKGYSCKSCVREKKRSPNYYRKIQVAKAKIIAKDRDSWTCQRCGRSKDSGYQIHGSHVFSEGGHRGMSADPLNIKAMCAQCHLWWHENPAESMPWYKEKFPERYEYLLAQSRKTIQIDWKSLDKT